MKAKYTFFIFFAILLFITSGSCKKSKPKYFTLNDVAGVYSGNITIHGKDRNGIYYAVNPITVTLKTLPPDSFSSTSQFLKFSDLVLFFDNSNKYSVWVGYEGATSFQMYPEKDSITVSYKLYTNTGSPWYYYELDTFQGKK